MEQFTNIRALYIPFQPKVNQSGQYVIYREIAPDEILQNTIVDLLAGFYLKPF